MSSSLNFSKYIELPDTAYALYEEYRDFQAAVPDSLFDYLRGLCMQKGIPYQVIVALVSVESDWRIYAKSYNKKSDTWDCGLGQINSRNFELFAKSYLEKSTFNPYDAHENLEVVVAHFSFLYKHLKGDIKETLIAYNTGLNGRIKPNVRPLGLKYAQKVYNRLVEIRS